MQNTAQFTGQKYKQSFMGKAMVSRFLLALVFCAAFFASASANVSTQAREPGIDIKELDKRASQLMHQLEMVGLSVAVVENGKMTWAKGYGETLRNSNMQVTADTVFRWASVSKGVAAATVLSLEEDGHLTLAEPATLHAASRAKTVRRALKDLKYLCEPGTCHTYQNAAYDASAEIVESVTGLPYKSAVQEWASWVAH